MHTLNSLVVFCSVVWFKKINLNKTKKPHQTKTKPKTSVCSTDGQKCHCQIPHCRSLSGRALLKKQEKTQLWIVAADFSPTRWQQLAKVYMCNKLYTPHSALNHHVGSNLGFKSFLDFTAGELTLSITPPLGNRCLLLMHRCWVTTQP